jgi:hypothetical protein
MKKIIVSFAVILMIFLASCGSSKKKDTTNEAVKPKATTIKTSMGILTIDKVTIALTDPYRPNTSSVGNTAPDGYQYLGIAFNCSNSQNEIDNFNQASKDATVIGDDGSKPRMTVRGFSNGKLFISYLIKSTAKIFTLHWPDNSPIELIVSK